MKSISMLSPLLALASLALAGPEPGATPDRVPDDLQTSEWSSSHAAHEALKQRFKIQDDDKVAAQLIEPTSFCQIIE